MADSREQILNAIRRGLRRGPVEGEARAALERRLAEHPAHLIPARSRLPQAGRIELFVAQAEREYASVDRIRGIAALPQAVADYLARHNLPGEVAMAPHPLLEAAPWGERPLLRLRRGAARGEDAVSVSVAFAGIAETGTLMMPSGPASPTTLNILPDTAIIVLPAGRVLGAYEEAWALLRRELPAMPRNVMLITGPSRTADIEQTIELGVHGPRRLHVVLVEDAGPA